MTERGVPRNGTEIQRAIEEAHSRFRNLNEGSNASYIPSLARVPSELFGIAVVTAQGEIYETGDARHEFAIESISKVLTLALVTEEIGAAAVRTKVGADPTGFPFNSVIAIELHGGKPLTPLVNAGAIATVSLVKASSAEERWAKILSAHSGFAGRQLSLSRDVYQSEAATNFHNRAIAWLLYSYGNLYCDPMEACDVYTRQCSIGITTVDLATMRASLAASGLNPRTKQRSLDPGSVPGILAEMTMEGLYTASGDWAYNVGLPGKSGVGGGLLAVAPGMMAIAAFSPPLDQAGNSVRAQHAIRDVATKLGLNVYSGNC